MFYRIDQLIEEYKNMPINLWTANRFNCQMLFCSELLIKDELVDATKFYDFLMNYDKSEWMEKLVSLTQYITPRGGIWFYGKKREVVEQDFLEELSLKVKWSEPINSPYYFFCNHYLFVKK